MHFHVDNLLWFHWTVNYKHLSECILGIMHYKLNYIHWIGMSLTNLKCWYFKWFWCKSCMCTEYTVLVGNPAHGILIQIQCLFICSKHCNKFYIHNVKYLQNWYCRDVLIKLLRCKYIYCFRTPMPLVYYQVGITQIRFKYLHINLK